MAKYNQKDIEVFLSKKIEIKENLLKNGKSWKNLDRDFLLEVCNKEPYFIKEIVNTITEREIVELFRKNIKDIENFKKILNILSDNYSKKGNELASAFAEVYLNPISENCFKDKKAKDFEKMISDDENINLFNFYNINWLNLIVNRVKFNGSYRDFIKTCDEEILKKAFENNNVFIMQKHIMFKINMSKEYESNFLVQNLETMNSLIKENFEKNNDVVLFYIIQKDLFKNYSFRKLLINEIQQRQKQDDDYFVEKIFVSATCGQHKRLLEIKELKTIFEESVRNNLSFFKIITENKIIEYITHDDLKKSILNDLRNNGENNHKLILKIFHFVNWKNKQDLFKEWLKDDNFLEQLIKDKNNITLLTKNDVGYNPEKIRTVFSKKSIKEIKELILNKDISNILYIYNPDDDLLSKVNKENPELITKIDFNLIKNSHAKKFIFENHPEMAQKFTEEELLDYYPSVIFIKELESFFKNTNIKKMKEIFITKDENKKEMSEIEILIDKILIEKNKNIGFKI